MIKWNKLMDKKWVVAVSGGADSMALLDMCVAHHLQVVVAHVNYQKRESANRDMQGVQAYCKKKQIPCFVHMVTQYKKGYNFQAQAREIRYQFFKQICEEKKAAGVLVAHQLDDVIETYIMQLERGSKVTCYGISEETLIDEMLVKRILLDYTKQQLESYCQKRKITYYDDESNFADQYKRNQIRHHIVERMSDEQKRAYQKEIKEKNKAWSKYQREIGAIAHKLGEVFSVKTFCEIKCSYQKDVLREWIATRCQLHQISDKNINTLITMITHKNKNWRHNINEHYDLLCEYGNLCIYEKNQQGFAYVYEQVRYEKTPYFTIAQQGKRIEGVTLSEKDFPITIRNAKEGDKIRLRIGSKKVSRFFIDNKISHNERKNWPVVVNCKGNVIFVHKIGCDIEHYSNNSTIFVLK
ncbi:MAG: tRNA lysidine(34) synthetase TilS [Erysipelotrichia bacterium]|nr:tRNA lysidine(34) synthetase TilS [Erysipelotrichia bacterium]NCC54949.1 tRNA lysidine(34) synthetase TilS [Erysipelotrichia bacterium]